MATGKIYICRECGKVCEPNIVDNGIGPYEYWGATGIDHKYDVESDCCWADVEDATRHLVLPVDIKEDEDY